MKISEARLKVEKTARYFTNSPASVTRVIFVIHGYAQLAKDFISEFEFLDDGNTLIVAPEGLSKFYSRNNVGASWMTRAQREDEINDYILYLESLEDNLFTSLNLSGVRTSVLGFSQGVHTAARWFIASGKHHERLILCSSDFPADADFERLRQKLTDSRLIYTYGKNDMVVSEDTIFKTLAMLGMNSIEFETISFEGRHEINPEAVLSALKH